MVDYESLKARVQELAEREWDIEAIVARYRRMAETGIPQKALNPDEVLANREQILDRVQRRAEEYNFLARNCAKGTALALMEEFGLGNLEIIQGLSPFPGFGGTGWMCGAVTGGADCSGPLLRQQGRAELRRDQGDHSGCANIHAPLPGDSRVCPLSRVAGGCDIRSLYGPGSQSGEYGGFRSGERF